MPRTREALTGTNCYIPGPRLLGLKQASLLRLGLKEFEALPCRDARLHGYHAHDHGVAYACSPIYMLLDVSIHMYRSSRWSGHCPSKEGAG